MKEQTGEISHRRGGLGNPCKVNPKQARPRGDEAHGHGWPRRGQGLRELRQAPLPGFRRAPSSVRRTGSHSTRAAKVTPPPAGTHPHKPRLLTASHTEHVAVFRGLPGKFPKVPPPFRLSSGSFIILESKTKQCFINKIIHCAPVLINSRADGHSRTCQARNSLGSGGCSMRDPGSGVSLCLSTKASPAPGDIFLYKRN